MPHSPTHTHIHTLIQGDTRLHIRRNLGFSIFLKATSTCNWTEPGFERVTFWSLDNLLYTHIHTLMTEAAMQSANCTSGPIWGSVFSSRPLQHAQPSTGELAFEPVTFWSLDILLHPLSYSCPKKLILNVPECSRCKFAKNIPKMFCDNLLKMFTDDIVWMLCPTVLENVLSRMFSLNGLAFQYSKHFTVLVTFTHLHTHSYTDGRSCYERCQLHIKRNLGFSILHKDTLTRSSNQQSDDLLYLLAELQPPQKSCSKFPECSRITFSKNITKMFSDNLKMFTKMPKCS